MWVDGSRDDLHRLALNLLENALRHTPPGTAVRASVGRRAGEAVLVVEDRGPGIAPELRERIFERFVRVNDPELAVQPGTGLGLYIGRELARRQGAELSVAHSEPGGGSTLALRLDLARSTLTTAPT